MIGSIGDRATFAALRRARRVRRGGLTVAFFDDGNGTVARVAFAVNRKVGMAVVRNRLRRRLREIARRAALPPGAWLISASPAAADAGFATLSDWFTDAVAALAA